MKTNKADVVKKFIASREEAIKLVEEIDKGITLYDFIVRKRARIVSIEHWDGSYLEFHSACVRKLNKEWYVVFTEHHGRHLYHYEDIKRIKQWMPQKVLYRSKDLGT